MTLVSRPGSSLIVTDLCAPGVSVRVTKYAERKATPTAWAQSLGLEAATNGDFFDFPGWTLVMGRSRGAGQDWPVGKQNLEIRGYWQFGPGFATFQADGNVPPSAAATEVISGHDLLISNGAPLSAQFPGNGLLATAHRRTALGLSQNRRYLFQFVSTNNLTGDGIVAEMTAMQAESGAPAIWWATNQDGGGSSQGYVAGVGSLFPTGRLVNNHLGVHANGSGAAPNCPAPACTNGCQPLVKNVVGITGAPTGFGYRTSTTNGAVKAFGNLTYKGGMLGAPLNKPIVGIANTPSGLGYWLVAADGGIFSFGDAAFFGSTGGITLNKPIVGIAAAPDGKGYWLVASDGGIFAFGSAKFFGSLGGASLNKPIVGIAAAPDGKGYWLVGADGGIFSFGSAGFHGSLGGTMLNKPIVAIAAAKDGKGYTLLALDGGIFSFGSAKFFGSAGGNPPPFDAVGLALTYDGNGYWIVFEDGGIFSYGNAKFLGSAVSFLGCQANAVVSCVDPQNTGCYSWKVDSTCASNETCRNGNCEPKCTSECTSGETQCTSGKLESCVNNDSDTCLEFGNATACSAGKTCTGNACVAPTCTDACAAKDLRCNGSTPQHCVDPATGCNSWANSPACAMDEHCEQGVCVAGPPPDTTTDANEIDGGEEGPDAGESDGGELVGDGGESDSGLLPDGGTPGKTGPPTGSCGCSGAFSAPMGLLGLALAARRRRSRNAPGVGRAAATKSPE